MKESPADKKEQHQAMLLQWLGATEGSRKWILNPQQDLLIGRDEECDIVLDNRLVSRTHARIYWQDGDFFIRDLDSKNGTHVNGQSIRHDKRLQNGDEVQVALCYKLAYASEDATTDLAWESTALGLEMDPDTRMVTLNGIPLEPPLSLMQFRFLHALWQAGGGIVSRDQIKRAVWPEDDPSGISRQSMDALVRRLRSTLAEFDAQTEYILTVRGHGYRLHRVTGSR